LDGKGKLCFSEKFTKIGVSIGKTKSFLAFDGDIYPVGILPFGGRIDMIFDVFPLPEVPDCDEETALGF